MKIEFTVEVVDLDIFGVFSWWYLAIKIWKKQLMLQGWIYGTERASTQALSMLATTFTNDKDRYIITRWRLPNHDLKIDVNGYLTNDQGEKW